MKKIFYLSKKDFQSFFLSPLAIIILPLYFLVSSYFFLNFLGNFNLELRNANLNAFNLNLNQVVIEKYFVSLLLINLVLIPLLASRSLVEEFRHSTASLLFSYPLKDIDIAVAKFLGQSLFLILLLLIAFILPTLLIFISNIEVLPVLSGFLGLVVSSLALFAFCLGLSSICKNYLNAGFISFSGLLILFCIHLFSSRIPLKWAELFNHFSPFIHCQKFIEGNFNFSSLVFFISLGVCGIILSCIGLKYLRYSN